jgi:hypothetical protein
VTVWRIKINSGRAGVDWDQAKAYCRQQRIVGVGWGGHEVLRDGATLDEVLDAIRAKTDPGWNPTGPTIVRRLAEDVQDGDLIWTRDRQGFYWLGHIEGPWRYDSGELAWRWDVNNIRPCTWLSQPLRDFEIPGAVVRNFAGVGQTLRRIRNEPAVRVTEMLWERASNPTSQWPPMAPEDVLTGLLDPIDVEDVVLLLLQAEDWLLLPSSRMHDTPVYEAALRHRDGRLAVVSVKSGPSSPVPIPELAEAAGDAQAYAYSTHDRYTDDPAKHGVIALHRHQLVDFMAAHPALLPPRVTQWLTGSMPASQQTAVAPDP